MRRLAVIVDDDMRRISTTKGLFTRSTQRSGVDARRCERCQCFQWVRCVLAECCL